ncbi:MAG: hypothetical protein IPP74_14815 [Alphaproteobacteria bacterium]|nr:hypothetical protein [Alphaproteobacteria bacterium]
MAPKYNPLAVGQPQGIPMSGLLGQDFNTEAIDWNDEMKLQAALRAQALAEEQSQMQIDQAKAMNPMLLRQSQQTLDANQIKLQDAQNEQEFKKALQMAMSAEPQQRADQAANQISSDIQATADANGVAPGQISPLRNPEDASAEARARELAKPSSLPAQLDLGEGLALKYGMLDEAARLQNSKRTAGGDRLLTDTELAQFGLPEGSTVQTLKADQAAKRLALGNKNSAIADRRTVTSETNTKIRQGTAPKGLTDSEVQSYNALDDLSSLTKNVKETYMPYISENRAERFLAAATNPNSAAARMQAELTLLTTQMAAAWNGKRLSDLDYKTMAPLTQINDLDTLETVSNKLDRLEQIASIRRDNLTSNLEKSGRNVDNFKVKKANRAPFDVPRNADGSVLTKEQFQAWQQGKR